MKITTLTNDMIATTLNTELAAIKMVLSIVCVIFVVAIVVAFIKFRKEDPITRNKYIIVGAGIMLLLLAVPLWNTIRAYDAISYSIKNRCWTVEKDIIMEKNYELDEDGDKNHYVILNNHGKISVSQSKYFASDEREVVYVIIAKGRLGGIYTSKTFYSATYYYYEE